MYRKARPRSEEITANLRRIRAAEKLDPPALENAAENECLRRLRRKGYDVTKRGWPDFLVFRPDGSLVCVEVKRTASDELRVTQQRVMHALLSAGIECYRFDPESGFSRLRITPQGMVDTDRIFDDARGRWLRSAPPHTSGEGTNLPRPPAAVASPPAECASADAALRR